MRKRKHLVAKKLKRIFAPSAFRVKQMHSSTSEFVHDPSPSVNAKAPTITQKSKPKTNSRVGRDIGIAAGVLGTALAVAGGVYYGKSLGGDIISSSSESTLGEDIVASSLNNTLNNMNRSGF